MDKQKLTLYDKMVWDMFTMPGEVMEVRILNASGKIENKDYIRNATISGYFDDFDSFVKCTKGAEQGLTFSGIYFTLQVIDPRLIGRAFNRLKPATLTTSDNDVRAYRWLLIDCDPVRPSGISSSEVELKAALQTRNDVCLYLESEFQFAKPLKAMSGNGYHALYQLPDMPVNDESKVFLKGILNTLSARFDSDKVKIDRTVFNPARICKLYGSRAYKGDVVPAGYKRDERPHRVSYIEEKGDK